MSTKHLRAEQLEYLEKAVGGLFVAFLFVIGNLILEKVRRAELEKRIEKLEQNQDEKKCENSET